MTESEKEAIVQVARKMVARQFLFDSRFARALNGGQENTKMENFIIEETIQGLENIKIN